MECYPYRSKGYIVDNGSSVIASVSILSSIATNTLYVEIPIQLRKAYL